MITMSYLFSGRYIVFSKVCPSIRLSQNCVHSVTGVGGWSGGAKVLCIMRHWGVQLILDYSWARPAILVAGKGRVEGKCFYFFCFFTSISVSLSSLSLSFIPSAISSVAFLFFFGRRHKMTHKG